MTQYLTESSINQSILNTMSSANACFCCLAQNETMIDLKNCKHKDFLQQYFTMEYLKLVLACNNCHNMLKKITIFKTQVEESRMILKGRMFNKTINKLYNLQQSDTTITFDPIDVEETDFEIKDESQHIEDTEFVFQQNMELDFKDVTEINSKRKLQPSNEQDSLQVITDVKIEHESSDFENDIPLAQIKNKTQKCGTKIRMSLGAKYKGKIKVVALSKRDLMDEREREAKKESYLKLPFRCESCIKGFDHEVTLKSHNEKQHEKEGEFRCDICKSVLGSAASYKEHTKRHLRRYECMVCGKRTTDLYSIAQHYNNQHGAGGISLQFSCDQCDFNTDSHRTYRYHREKHKHKAHCTICGSTFVNNGGLKVHMNTVHKLSSRQYKCSVCDKSYKCKSGLLQHTASVHAGQGAYCAKCRTHFATKNTLVHHLKTHSAHVTDDTKKFVCYECDAKFLTKTALQTHIDWDHLKMVKYECDKCAKVFKTAATLKKHTSFVHEKKRPPRDKICDHCGRGFTTSAILVSHIRTHTGERPLQCARCDASFAHGAALYTHNKLIHRK